MVRIFLLLVLGGAAVWMGLGWAASDEDPTPTVVVMQPAVSWAPERPGEGRLFRIRLTASEHTPVRGVHGQAGSEELHFQRLDERIFESLAAVPVDADSTLTATFRVVYESGTEVRFSETVSVTPGSYVHEELRVAPRFAAAPDSADEARLVRDREMAAEASRTAHRTRRLWTDTTLRPRDSRVTSGFGDGRIFNGRLSSRHLGLDLRGSTGDTVVAAARGVVAITEPFLLAGNVVYVDHGAGLLSAYFHLSEHLVEVGDTVEAGDPVGRVGATGRVTGPHLHWVVRYGRTSVDPRSLLEVMGSR